MHMISEAEAFRGRWSVHPLGWALLLIPIIALVGLQETSTGFPTFPLVIASALAQHAVAGALIVGVGTLALRRMRQLPLVLVFSLWAGSGVLRGVAGGAVAAWLEGQAPEYGYRIAYWVTVSLIWMPLFTYLLAQLELRGILLSELARVENELARAQERARQTVEQRTAELTAAVATAVAPLIADVRQALAAAAEHDNEIALDTISGRLETVANEVRSVVQPPDQETKKVDLSARPHWSPVVEALAVSRARPFFVGSLTTVAVLALFVPESLRAADWEDVALRAGAIAAGAVALIVGLLIARKASRFTTRHAVLVLVLSAIAAQAVLAIALDNTTEPRELALIAAVPLAFGTAAALLSSAVGVATGNLKMIEAQSAYEAKAHDVLEQSRVRDAAIARQVAELLHGPILGRLSACIMALNFYLAEPENRRGLRRNATTDGVLAHLDLVAGDLEKLGLTPT